MSKTASLTITLPADMAELVRAKVASGEFATEIEVVSEGLKALALKESTLERWLREDVAQAYDEFKAHPGAKKSIEDAFSDLDSFMSASERAAR
ncbi:ribbon-helix-helix domain-containing protein [Peteryoungia ipomoeae]|uniref:Type II toxin-antitoxin system ParD family antitoxin n=1 Tax=Peteryoungia ipomoeae TaxID=1210932 RepID=A0A4S8NWV2_9HYPH|nr:type II toxin-antitoxin system ParD family antitoxin [Peteryoungia ipomoeae]THV21405.1 type II toxin-antitoxin system ParD family antitoxin [Peteryoungia ipomoeae]